LTGGNWAFSLSSPETSSLLRFLARVFFVSLAYAGTRLLVVVFAGSSGAEAEAGAREDVGIALEEVEALVLVRVLRVAGAFAAAFVDAAVAFGLGAVSGDAAVTGLITSAGADACRSSRRVVWRVTTGMRLTRRSRRDCILAHCASHWARSFSQRASTKAGVSEGSNTPEMF
jgi:hypothetical protein